MLLNLIQCYENSIRMQNVFTFYSNTTYILVGCDYDLYIIYILVLE